MKSKKEIIPFIKKRINERSWLPENAVKITTANQTKYAGILGACYLLKNINITMKSNYDKNPSILVSNNDRIAFLDGKQFYTV